MHHKFGAVLLKFFSKSDFRALFHILCILGPIDFDAKPFQKCISNAATVGAANRVEYCTHSRDKHLDSTSEFLYNFTIHSLVFQLK